MIRLILEKFPLKRLIKFIITGGVALAIDMAIYFILTRYGNIYYLFGRIISLGIAIIWNFSINRIWTFSALSGKVTQQMPRFLVVIFSTSLLSLILMHIGVSVFHFNDLLVLIVVAVTTTLINFSAHSFWSYSKY
jgi:putative flippase GtrA